MSPLFRLTLVLIGGGLAGYLAAPYLAPGIFSSRASGAHASTASPVPGSSEVDAARPINPLQQQRLAALEKVAAGTSEELAGAVAKALAQEDQAMLATLLELWTTRSPEAAIQYGLSLAEEKDRERVLFLVFEAWARSDSATALARVRSLEETDLRDKLLAIVVRETGRQNPREGLRLVSELPPNLQYGPFIEIFSHWTTLDPSAARAMLDEMSPAERMRGLRGYFNARFAHDPEDAMREALLIGGDHSTDRQMALIFVTQGLVRVDIEQALSFLDQSLSTEMRQRVGSSLSWELGNSYPREYFKWATENLNDFSQRQAVETSIGKLAASAPAEAARMLDTLPAGESYEAGFSTLMEAWSESDPLAALHWATGQAPSATREKALETATRALVESDPEASLAYVQEMEDPGQRQALLSAIAEKKAEADPYAALTWTRSLDPAMQDSARDRILTSWADRAPTEVAAYLASTSTSPNPPTAEKIVNAWAKQDARAAADWALTQSDAETQWRAINRATGEWLRQDSLAASEWIAEMPSGRAREEAVENLVERIRYSDPAAAFQWIESMEEPDRRLTWARMTFESWSNADEAAATAALDASQLTEAEKAEVRAANGG